MHFTENIAYCAQIRLKLAKTFTYEVNCALIRIIFDTENSLLNFVLNSILGTSLGRCLIFNTIDFWLIRSNFCTVRVKLSLQKNRRTLKINWKKNKLWLTLYTVGQEIEAAVSFLSLYKYKRRYKTKLWNWKHPLHSIKWVIAKKPARWSARTVISR